MTLRGLGLEHVISTLPAERPNRLHTRPLVSHPRRSAALLLLSPARPLPRAALALVVGTGTCGWQRVSCMQPARRRWPSTATRRRSPPPAQRRPTRRPPVHGHVNRSTERQRHAVRGPRILSAGVQPERGGGGQRSPRLAPVQRDGAKRCSPALPTASSLLPADAWWLGPGPATNAALLPPVAGCTPGAALRRLRPARRRCACRASAEAA